METSSTVLILLTRPLIDEPRILIDVKTECGVYEEVFSLAYLSDNEFWIRGRDAFIRLYNFQGKLLKLVCTKSGNKPWDLGVTLSGDLVYTDYSDSSINIVSDTQIQTLIRLHGWKPGGVCTTSSGDFLVYMISEDKEARKVVRYSGSTEKQSIQWDDKGQPLSSSKCLMYLCENRNLDICLADYGAQAVVVVSAAGKLRFRYTSDPKFRPWGITTDSQSRILTADCNNNRIHILDQNGHFLRCIENCGLQKPIGLCVDSEDNLFVSEVDTCKVKKIKYCK